MHRLLGRICLVGAAFLGGAATSRIAHSGDGDDTYRSLAVFARVLNYVENNYVRPVAADDLIYGAIRGMLATLDPHSVFLDPEQYAAIKSEAQGEFGGIGVELVRRPGGVRVVERYEGSPALKAGLRIGDLIIAVDGTSLAERSLVDVVRRIKGPAGSTVRLTVLRGPLREKHELDVVRSLIRVVSVDARSLGDGIGYVRIRSFTERTGQDVVHALARLKSDRALTGLVLDLRDNPGGLLNEAVRVADIWLDQGVIVSTEGRNQPPDQEVAHPKGTEPGYPIIVLANGGTASASEIVAGALQDHARAKVMGTQTFGKGSVQTVIELEDKSALKLTVARYFTPKHRSIMGVGITPDIVVPDRPLVPPTTSAAKGSRVDSQLQAAIADLRGRSDL